MYVVSSGKSAATLVRNPHYMSLEQKHRCCQGTWTCIHLDVERHLPPAPLKFPLRYRDQLSVVSNLEKKVFSSNAKVTSSFATMGSKCLPGMPHHVFHGLPCFLGVTSIECLFKVSPVCFFCSQDFTPQFLSLFCISDLFF